MRYFAIKALLLCLLLLVTSCGPTNAPASVGISTPAATSAPTGATFVVQRGQVVRTLEFDGRISPVEELPLYFKSPGFVKQVYVRPGDQVQVGDLLAELETDELMNQIAQAEVTLDSAQLLLAEAEKALAQEVALAELNVALAEAALTQAERANTHAINQTRLSLVLAQEELSRTMTLQASYVADVVSARITLQRAQEVVHNAEVEYQEALDRPWEKPEGREWYAEALRLARRGLEPARAQYDQALASEQGYWNELSMRETSVAMVQAQLEQLQEGVDPALSIQVQQAQLVLEGLKDSVDPSLVNDARQAQLALEGLRGQLTSAQIVAPVDGQVFSLSVQPARPVEAFRTVIVIGDSANLQVSADLSQDQLKDLTEGQKASIVLESDPGRTWSGSVLRLPYPYGTRGGAESEIGSDGLVYLGLDGDTGGVGPGAVLHVTVVLQEKDDALWLPPAAIRAYQGRNFVTVQQGERQRRADVELGIEGQDQVEVLKGLEEGQLIVAP